MIYVTEKQRFYARGWLGAKKLVSIQAYVWVTEYTPTAEELVTEMRTIGTLREYSVAGWKELMSKPDIWYRSSERGAFVKLPSTI